ncbi:MAG: tRNA preQ1(34) S-adenosylmethionine ribosyltransferase-isomerase QueA [Magnetococcales bacterium]|nr:tRNA preQ1(34) S-adenosylmethionine ribosyltransferase-isomerase QueA [Magnetococcales bacterium]
MEKTAERKRVKAALSRWKRDDFDYHLPEERIAQHPAQPRDSARLLVSRSDEVHDGQFRDILDHLQAGDALVLNDTRVIPARLQGTKPTGGKVELLLVRPLAKADCWRAMGRSGKPLRPGQVIQLAEGFSAEVLERKEEMVEIRLASSQGTVQEAIETHGRMPLPPYIQSAGQKQDRDDYQTIFARHDGAVAAPTAGLHITPGLMDAIKKRGVSIHHLTLHVGLGTFRPVRENDLSKHVMHHEWCELSQETAEQLNAIRIGGGRTVAVGTTVVRTLESAADSDGRLRAFCGETDLFILPGYQFKAVDRMVTNFHLPKSTLLMLVAAFIGKERMDRDYRFAIDNGFRFYSYGDASLLYPQ